MIPVNINQINLSYSFHVDESHSKEHPHMIHSHPNMLELLYIAGGNGSYLVDRQTYSVKEGDIIICNGRVLHGELSSQKNALHTYCLALSGVHLQGLEPDCLVLEKEFPIITLYKFRDVIHQTLPLIHQYFFQSNDKYALSRHLAISILLMVLEEKQMQANQTKIIGKNKQYVRYLVRSIAEYLDIHYIEAVSVAKLSQQLRMSESYLSHLFKRETGLSPKQYIMQRRIGEAQTLLSETNLPIQEIENLVGFGSGCHLTATFKKYVGISPSEYRKYFQNSDLIS